MRYVPVLTIAGSDSSGGAGIQADIKAMSALGCYAMSVITALTAQNTTGVTAIEGVSPYMVEAQIDAVFADIPPLAVKTGMLYDRDIVTAVSDRMRRYKVTGLVVDPVMMSTSGSKLIADNAIEALRELLFPQALMITPNKSEAQFLSGSDDVYCQINRLSSIGAGYLLLKGGDDGRTDKKVDYLVDCRSGSVTTVEGRAIATRNTHGTGCTLSSAIASFIALGADVPHAVTEAKYYIQQALIAGADIEIGKGHGPVNHFFDPKSLIVL